MKQLLSILTMAALLLVPSPTRAEDFIEAQFLVLTQNDGTVSKFALNKAPELSFNGNQLVISCEGDELSTDLSDVENYSFVTEKIPTAVKPITIGEGNDMSDVAFHNAQISGLKVGTHVTVFDINGKALNTLSADAEGKVQIDLSNLPRGIFILRTPTKSFKMVNR